MKNTIMYFVLENVSKMSKFFIISMTAEADSIKSLKQVENTDPIGTGFTNLKTRFVDKKHPTTNNYA